MGKDLELERESFGCNMVLGFENFKIGIYLHSDKRFFRVLVLTSTIASN